MEHLRLQNQLVALLARVHRPIGIEVIDDGIRDRAGIGILYFHIKKRRNIHKRWDRIFVIHRRMEPDLVYPSIAKQAAKFS